MIYYEMYVVRMHVCMYVTLTLHFQVSYYSKGTKNTY